MAQSDDATEPCAGLALRPDDAAALHYRHLATSLVRALRRGVPLDQVRPR